MIAKDARLHEATVRRAESHVEAYAPGRRQATEVRSRATRVEVTYAAHPLVWEQAIKLAGGDASRLEVVDYETVRVR